jgi:hypothetical protein
MGVLHRWASVCPKCLMTWLMKVDWESEMVWDGLLWLIAIPNANLAGPGSLMSQQDLRKSQNRLFFSGDDTAENMSSTWTLKITVLVGDWQM